MNIDVFKFHPSKVSAAEVAKSSASMETLLKRHFPGQAVMRLIAGQRELVSGRRSTSRSLPTGRSASQAGYVHSRTLNLDRTRLKSRAW